MTQGTFTGDELHLHVCGSVSASLVPWWIHWLRQGHPDLTINVSLTPSALRFVSFDAVRALVDGAVWTDSWTEPGFPNTVNHGESGCSAAIILFPATLDSLMRLSQGRADSPAMMMLQLARVPIIVADTLPGTNEIVEAALERLDSRTNLRFAPRVTGVRASNRSEVSLGFNLPGAIDVANEMLKERKR